MFWIACELAHCGFTVEMDAIGNDKGGNLLILLRFLSPKERDIGSIVRIVGGVMGRD